MTNPDTLESLARWFRSYRGGFAPEDPRRGRVIDLKAEHCAMVREESRGIAESLGMGREDVLLAEAAGLLHDVGRFHQVARFGTFADFASVNHARLGVRVLHAEGVLRRFDGETRRTILIAIENHNKPGIPAGVKGRALAHSRLVRDADKLDIYRMLTDTYGRGGKPAAEGDALFFGLPDEEKVREREPPGEGGSPSETRRASGGPAAEAAGGDAGNVSRDVSGEVVSARVYRSVIEGRVVPFSELETLNDFKLLQMGWVYDLNFTESCRRVRARRFLEKIRESMPRSKKVDEVYERARSHLEDRGA
jgi:putative nucleotidyltransferase with HDIG domain